MVAPDATPAACLPDLPSPTITLLDGDAHTLRVCIEAVLRDTGAQVHCFAIDRRDGAIAARAPLGTARSTLQRRHPSATYKDTAGICASDGRCIAAHRLTYDNDVVDSADVDDAVSYAVVVSRHRSPPSPAHFDIYAQLGWLRLDVADSLACGTAFALDEAAFVATDDCETGTGHASFFDLHGHRIATLGGDHPLNSYGAYPFSIGRKRWAIVTPAAYAIVLIDLPVANRQDMIDLVPIQARATEHPDFAVAKTTEGTWIVASPTGGVAVIDPTVARLTSSWIIPPCDSADGASPTAP